MSGEPIVVVVDAAHDGARLDRALAELLPDRSRASIQKHIEVGAVLVDGALPKRGAKTPVRASAVITYRPPPPEEMKLLAEDIPLSVIFEDAHLLAIDKPAGLVVHPALGHASGTLVNAVLHHVRAMEPARGDLRPGIVHRLDRDTTGVILVAKTERVRELLSAAFKDRQVQKQYVAVARGAVTPRAGTFDTLYGRHPRHRKRFSSRVAEGKRAVTHYRTVETFVGASYVEIDLQTGRTHQIRVHFADAGCALVGDATYGGRRAVRDPRLKQVLDAFARPALHARRLSITHPITGETMVFEAPIPPDLGALLEALRGL